MLRPAFLIGCLTLSGCEQTGPVACDRVEETIFACMDGAEAKRFAIQGDSRALFEKCIPMSKRETIRGTWTTDFEFNVFREGEVVTGDRAFELPKRWVELLVDGTDLEGSWVAGAAQVYEVTFVGRKPVCNVSELVKHVLVDKVTSVRLVEKRPSKFP